MGKDRITYAEHEEALNARFPAGLRVDSSLETNNRTSWASDTPYSYYLSPRPHEPRGARKLSGKKSLPETTASQLKPKPARLKKKRTLSENSTPRPQRPSTAPTQRSPSSAQKDARPMSLPEYPMASSSRSTSKQNLALANELKTRSMWITRRLHALEQESSASASRNNPVYAPSASTSSFNPTHVYVASSSKANSRSKTPSSVSTGIDEEEFLMLADTSFPSRTTYQAPAPLSMPLVRHRSKRASVATSLSLYSQLSCPHDLQGDETPPEVESHGTTQVILQDPDSEDETDHPKKRLQGTEAHGNWDRQSTRTISTIRAPNSRSLSKNNLAGWVGYDPDTQSLRTIDDGRTIPTIPSESESEPEGGESRCATPTLSLLRPPTMFNEQGSSASSTFSCGTPPMSPTSTLVAGASSRISTFSELTTTSGTVVGSARGNFDTSSHSGNSFGGKASIARLPKLRTQAAKKPHPLSTSTLSASATAPQCPSPTLSYVKLSLTPSTQFERERELREQAEYKLRRHIRRHPSTILEDAICLDYDYAAAVNMLIHGINALPDSSSSDSNTENDDGCGVPAGMDKRLGGSKPVSRSSTVRSRHGARSGGRQMWIGKRGSTKKGRIRRSDVGDQERGLKPKRSIFSQVTHLFAKS